MSVIIIFQWLQCFLFIVYSFHCRNFAVSNLPTSNCQDTVVNWLLLRNNFVTVHVRPVLIGAINPFKKIILYFKIKLRILNHAPIIRNFLWQMQRTKIPTEPNGSPHV
jgi:hypothetical protein